MRLKTKIAFTLLVTILLTACSNWNKRNVDATIVNGNKVVLAIEKYKQQNGKYPKKLIELTPSYIAELPLPLVGTKIWECVLEGDGFYLGVNDKNTELDPVLYITNNSQDWRMDTR